MLGQPAMRACHGFVRTPVFDHAENHIAAMADATAVTTISTCVRFRNASSHLASATQFKVK